jgi:hypothetical protein
MRIDDGKWDSRDLVTLSGAKLLSRPDMETRKVKGIETPQRVGRAEFRVESKRDEEFLIRIGSHYWNAAVSQFADIQGDTVDVTFLPYPWRLGERSGTSFFFYEIKETPN